MRSIDMCENLPHDWALANDGPISISHKTSHRKTSQSLGCTRLVFRVFNSLKHWAHILAVLLSSRLAQCATAGNWNVQSRGFQILRDVAITRRIGYQYSHHTLAQMCDFTYMSASWGSNIWMSTAYLHSTPDSKVHGANMGLIWGRQDPGGPHVGPMNFAIWVLNVSFLIVQVHVIYLVTVCVPYLFLVYLFVIYLFIYLSIYLSIY